MATEQFVQDLSFPVKVYVFLLHLLLLFLVVLFLQRPFKRHRGEKDGRKSRTITKENRAVTIESCEWVNSTLAWFYLHYQGKETPNIVKMWLRALNKQLQKDRKKGQRIVIDELCPGCLPPKLTSVYCLCVSGNMQCITFHVESVDLGFLVRVLHQSDAGVKVTKLEMHVVRLSGEVALHLSTTLSRLDMSAQFIGVPEIALSTKYLAEENDVDAGEIQEKVKEVICKTITNIPLAEATSKENLSEASSHTSKERLDSPTALSCLGEEGKLLVKVIKASGLCGKEKSGPISPYCIVSISNPLQRKRTSMIRDNDSPFWNEYFTFEITPVTKEITVDIYDYEKTGRDINSHMDDTEQTEEQDDYLGQVIVPLSTVNRDQTCRLILPILPKSSKSDHSTGDISLEFTFDKEGKVIDATLQLAGLKPKMSSPDPESPGTYSAPSIGSPVSPVVNGGDHITELNGHIPVTVKRHFESSLDELSQEIEAFEAMEGRPKQIELQKEVEIFDLPEPEVEPEQETKPFFVPPPPPPEVTEVVTPEPVLSHNTEPEQERDTNLPEEPKEIPTEEKSTNSPENKSAEEPEEKATETEQENIDTEETKQKDKKEEEKKKTADEQDENNEHATELNSKPKLRRSFNLFRKRPVSMTAMDRKNDKGEGRMLSRDDPVRHSYHAGVLPVAESSNLRKSTSQSSLLSYSPNPYSTLVLETVNKGEKKYSHIPPVMAKRKAYEKGGNKLHIYNNHIFTAVHFTGSPPDCGVCEKPIKGKIGKQGYKCRECKMVSHRECHYETTVMCNSDAVQHLNIEYVGDTEV